MESRTVYTSKKSFDENHFFRFDVFHEKYDNQKAYPLEPFENDYGFGKYEYCYKLIEIVFEENHDADSTNIDLRYVVAELTINEIVRISNYCQCEKCQMWFINPKKYIICGCCIGCLKCGFNLVTSHINQYVVRKTLEYIKENNIDVHNENEIDARDENKIDANDTNAYVSSC
jgi:hypothetical protein